MKIEVDDEVLEVLKGGAEPFVDTPNTVLRRLLGIDSAEAGKGSGSGSNGRVVGQDRAAPGSILPESAYELPILEELLAREGSGHANDITDAVGERLKDRLTKRDRERLNSGDIRWRNRVQFTRLTLRKLGLLEADSPRGIWELTEKGEAAAKSGSITI